MRIYLDNNVYSFIQEAREAREARQLFRAIPAEVLASDTVVLEAAPIKDREERLTRMAVLRAVSRDRIDPPFTYRQSQEVLREIRRCHPEWLRSDPALSSIDKILDVHRRRWKKLRNDVLFDPADGFPQYLQAVGSSHTDYANAQKQLRELRSQSENLSFQASDPEFQAFLEPLSQADRFWRLAAAAQWAAALDGAPEAGDFRDFLGPYLIRLPSSGAWKRFWYVEAAAEDLPLIRLHYAVAFHQPSRPVTRGNLLDAHHAVYLPDCDLFLTCDQDFFAVLNLVRAGFPSADLGSPVLVNRKPHRSSVEALRESLTDPNRRLL
jgi:hypothetical protein